MTEREYESQLRELEEAERQQRELIERARQGLEMALTEEVRKAQVEVLNTARHALRLTLETKYFCISCRDEAAKGRAEAELTFGNFVRESGALTETDQGRC